jgi:hypothetical protein
VVVISLFRTRLDFVAMRLMIGKEGLCIYAWLKACSHIVSMESNSLRQWHAGVYKASTAPPPPRAWQSFWSNNKNTWQFLSAFSFRTDL